MPSPWLTAARLNHPIPPRSRLHSTAGSPWSWERVPQILRAINLFLIYDYSVTFKDQHLGCLMVRHGATMFECWRFRDWRLRPGWIKPACRHAEHQQLGGSTWFYMEDNWNLWIWKPQSSAEAVKLFFRQWMKCLPALDAIGRSYLKEL